MTRLQLFTILLPLLFMNMTFAQDNLNYQEPPEEILQLVDVELAPSVAMDNKGEYMLFLYRNAYKSIEELSQKEMRLGGLRIDPARNVGSRTTFFNNLKIKKMQEEGAEPVQVSGLPKDLKLTGMTWSPNEKYGAFLHRAETGVELWFVEMATAKAQRLTGPKVNANMRGAIQWYRDSKALLVKMIPDTRQPLIDTRITVPTGPTISTNDGKKAQNRTYQDLLSDRNDEHNFEQLATSEVYKVTLDGTASKWMGSGMYSELSFSPDGQYVMVTTVERPFSYLVPYYRFPSKTVVYTQEAQPVKTLLDLPLIEDLPKGFMATRTGPRGYQWRSDRDATIVYAEALDGGDPANEAEFRDEVFEWEAPFKGKARSILKTINRFRGIIWGNDNVAIATDLWWNTRNQKTYLFNPSDPTQAPQILADRNYQDQYSNPGNFVRKKNERGRAVLAMDGDKLFLMGEGYTPEGQFPFLDEMNLKTGKTKRLYQSAYTDKLERLLGYDPETRRLLTRVEGQNEYPNFYFRDWKKDRITQLTAFKNPFKVLEDVHKEVITYKREDGLELSGTLYLPVGYDKEKKEKKPMILWAYPREYKDKASASQNTQNPNRFTQPSWASPVYWVTKGYVVLERAAFPIIGEGDTEPNDSFRKQLVANAKAAIDAVDALGYIDRERVAVGGHSYGAFMVANLLSHSNLFAAGIARSGAYNRTLTPFGFQSEERSYWEAPEVYYTMSPFMHAEKMKTPLLLVHGEADNNSGTYPMQSERYFNALKGLGATVRLVMFPKESHGYRAKETILHLLWEQDQWLDKYVMNKGETVDR